MIFLIKVINTIRIIYYKARQDTDKQVEHKSKEFQIIHTLAPGANIDSHESFCTRRPAYLLWSIVYNILVYLLFIQKVHLPNDDGKRFSE